MSGLLGKKLGMTQIFDEAGDVVPVTVIEAGPCVIVQKKTKDKDGYEAIQLGFEELPERKGGKGRRPFRFLREFEIEAGVSFEPGQKLTVDLFKAGDHVRITGLSKGKGFQGVIKRHGKAGGPASHGSRFHRSTGSIGQRTSPGEVFKNMKLPGHMGCERVTIRNLRIVQIRPEKNLMMVNGAVPGAKNSVLMIRI